MKQIIYKNSNCNISYKYYKNHLGQCHGLCVEYWYKTNNVFNKSNWVNDEPYGLSSRYYENGNIE